ncbi:hypothetical protein ACFFMN_34030 [Planobispora siamensis]|uniref:Uncharacterized protein n=1 Tax=Planobispora siamensis TaxID=936338 RepID=A0A8J3SCM3_9ACTN|nr:hypothetical protein [Planobispora siamensis]GIH91927.1 hypothetical protein Psi01_25570 [Planobispora siamensis]
MTRDDRDIEQAEQEAEASRRRAEADLAHARERALRSLTLAERLRRLREANHFGELLSEAFRGRRG